MIAGGNGFRACCRCLFGVQQELHERGVQKLRLTDFLLYGMALVTPCLVSAQELIHPGSEQTQPLASESRQTMSLAEFVALLEDEASVKEKPISVPVENGTAGASPSISLLPDTSDRDVSGSQRSDTLSGQINNSSSERAEQTYGKPTSMPLSEFIKQFSDDADKQNSTSRKSSLNTTPEIMQETGLSVPVPEENKNNTQTVSHSEALSYTGKLLNGVDNTQAIIDSPTQEVEPSKRRVLWSNSSSMDAEEGARESLDIYKAVHRAIGFHPDIAESMGKLYEQREAVNETRAHFLPQISSGLNSGYRTSTDRTDEAFNVSVSQLLYDFGKVSSAVDAAEYGVVRDRAAVLVTVDDLARDTARAFIEVKRYQVLVDIAEQFVSAVGDLQELAAKRSAKGASSRSDEIQAKSRKNSAQATVMQYRSRLDVWMTTLQNLIGVSGNVSFQGALPAQLSSACQRATEDFDNVPRLVMAEAEKAIAKANIKNAKAEILPTLSLNAGYDHFLNQADNNAFSEDEYFTFTLDLKSKIYEGGAISARRQSAEYALNRANAAKRSVLLDVERSLRESKAQSAVLSRRMKYLDERYEDIVKTQELYRQQYLSLGTRTLLDILNTEAEIYQSLFDIKNNHYELQRLQIDCLHSVAEIRDAFAIDPGLMQGMSINL